MIRNKRIVTILLTLVLTAVYFVKLEPAEASAGSKYITVNEFLKYIVTEMKLPVDETSDTPYIDAAKESGLIKEGEFKNYSDYLTRTDAAVIANRLDEKNLSYLFTENAIIFLRECDLFEGRLYYNVSGNFFPKGETIETYDAKKFGQDVVYPILKSAFPTENWIDQGVRTRYTDVYDKNGNLIKTVIMIGKASPDKNNVVEIKPIDEKSKVIDMWNYIKDLDRKINTVLEKRISDIKNIPKSKREAVAAVIAKGIMKGYSNGLYATSREFRGNNKITANGAKEVIQKVLNPEKRALVSPDGQLIRTTNLPKNANDYPYILECFPNEYYEMKYSFMYLTDYLTGKIKKDEYAYPKEVNYEYLYNKYYYNQLSLETGKYGLYDEMLTNVENYIKHIFNVNYRTVDKIWKVGLASSLCFYSWDNKVYEMIENYIENIKKNHVVVELDKIAIDPGSIYESRDYLYVRVYVKYRVTANEINVPSNQLIFNTNIENLKINAWKESIFDVMVEYRSENSVYKWAPTSSIKLSDWAYRESFK